MLMYIGVFLILHGGDHPIFYGKLFRLPVVRWLGDLLTAGGLLFSIWARAHLGKYWSGKITLKVGHKLIRTGPYRLVRHPIYTGLIAGALGGAIAAETGDALLGLAMFIASCFLKVRWEEELLTTEFGEEYTTFKREVPMIVPSLLGPRAIAHNSVRTFQRLLLVLRFPTISPYGIPERRRPRPALHRRLDVHQARLPADE